MRYLLEVLEADRARYSDLKQVYAFAEAKAGEDKLQEALWRAKGIDPVQYRMTSSGDHVVLYETLRIWRDYASSPTKWREHRIRQLTATNPVDGAAQGIQEVVSLLAHGDAASILAKVSPGPAWWAPLSENVTFEGRGNVLAEWLATRLGDFEMLRACVKTQPQDIGFYNRLRHALEFEKSGLDPTLVKAWRLLVEAGLTSLGGDRGVRWYSLEKRVREGDIDHGLRKAVVDSLRPRLTVGRPFEWPGISESDSAETETLERLMRVEFDAEGYPAVREVMEAWPADLVEETSLFRIAERALADALDEADDAGHLTVIDRESHDVASVSDYADGTLERGFIPITRLVVRLWDRIAAQDADGARALAKSWRPAKYLLQQRLYIHALSSQAFSGEEVCVALADLDDLVFWSYARKEIVRLLTARWDDLPTHSRQKLEERISLGPPRSLYWHQTDVDGEWQAVSDHLVFQRLEPLRSAGRALEPETLEALEGIQDPQSQLLGGRIGKRASATCGVWEPSRPSRSPS